MYQVSKYPHGTFSWAENISTEPELASAFYQDLFGWRPQTAPMGGDATYTLFQLGADKVAALIPMPREMRRAGETSFWNNYATVDDVDGLTAGVTRAGGEILFGPADVGDSGRMLYIADPAGARLGLWQAGGHIGAGVVNVPGAMVWNELVTKDVQASQAFYGRLLGWEFAREASGYTYIVNRGRRNGGFLKWDESFGDMQPHWRTYFNIADIDRGLEIVRKHGCEILIPKLKIPDEDSFFAFVSDPAGARFYLIQKRQLDPWLAAL